MLAARREAAGRRDVLRLAWLQLAGIVGQAVLGGITVLTDLHPLVVAGHFLLSMTILAAVVGLLDRVTDQPTVEPVAILRGLAVAVVVAAAVVLVLGTIVTATGPHAGDPGTPRLGYLPIRTAAFLHAGAVWLLVGLTVATWLVARGGRAPRTARAAAVLFAVELVQGTIGYVQYALGIPAELVSLHLVGAALTWIAALRVGFATRRPGGRRGDPVVAGGRARQAAPPEPAAAP